MKYFILLTVYLIFGVEAGITSKKRMFYFTQTQEPIPTTPAGYGGSAYTVAAVPTIVIHSNYNSYANDNNYGTTSTERYLSSKTISRALSTPVPTVIPVGESTHIHPVNTNEQSESSNGQNSFFHTSVGTLGVMVLTGFILQIYLL